MEIDAPAPRRRKRKPEAVTDETREKVSAVTGSTKAQSPLETYLKQINATALLTHDEENALGRRVADGDRACDMLADAIRSQPDAYAKAFLPPSEAEKETDDDARMAAARDRAAAYGKALGGLKLLRQSIALLTSVSDVSRREALSAQISRLMNGIEAIAALDSGGLIASIRDAKDARDHLAKANLRLVVSIARGFMHHGLSLEDLIQEGNGGLLRAVEGFDPAFNRRFSTYAGHWIRQSIKNALKSDTATIRIPAYGLSLIAKYSAKKREMEGHSAVSIPFATVAAAMGLDDKKQRLLHQMLEVRSASPRTGGDAAAGDGEERLGIEDCGDVADQDRVAGMEKSELIGAVLGRLETMDKREAAVLRMRFGLDDEQPRTLKDIGELLGITRERVRQIEDEALAKLFDEFDVAS